MIDKMELNEMYELPLNAPFNMGYCILRDVKSGSCVFRDVNRPDYLCVVHKEDLHEVSKKAKYFVIVEKDKNGNVTLQVPIKSIGQTTDAIINATVIELAKNNIETTIISFEI